MSYPSFFEKYQYVRDTCELIGATHDVVAPGIRLFAHKCYEGIKFTVIVVAIDRLRYVLFKYGIDIDESIGNEHVVRYIRFELDRDQKYLMSQAKDITDLIYSLIPLLLRYSQLKVQSR